MPRLRGGSTALAACLVVALGAAAVPAAGSSAAHAGERRECATPSIDR
ncbi:hypothetical protein [Actinoplanes sp. TFC3]|nr:hypothetical protein [Actinoplanes sp. TFC3]